MSTIVQSYDASNNAVYPVTHFRAVRDSSGTTLESMMQDVREMTVGYYECSTPGSTAAKTITTDSSVSLSTKILCKVKFVEKNTANNTTMNINGTGAKALYYNGVRAAANNSWYPNEVVDLYYDGTNYQAKSCADTLEYDVSLHQTHEITEITKTTRTLVFNGNVVSSWESETSISDSSVEGYTRSETNTGQDVDSTTVDGPNATYDSSANQTNVVYVTTHTYTHVVNNYTFQEAVNAVPMSYRHGGLKLRFISNSDGSVQSSDNKYVQYRLMNQNWSTVVTDWQGVDNEPTAGSNNLVNSGGVAEKLSELEIGIGKKIEKVFVGGWNYLEDFYNLVGTHYFKIKVKNTTSLILRSTSINKDIQPNTIYQVAFNAENNLRIFAYLKSGIVSTDAKIYVWDNVRFDDDIKDLESSLESSLNSFKDETLSKESIIESDVKTISENLSNVSAESMGKVFLPFEKGGFGGDGKDNPSDIVNIRTLYIPIVYKTYTFVPNGQYMYIVLYDENKAKIDTPVWGDKNNERTFLVPQNAKYFRLMVGGGNGENLLPKDNKVVATTNGGLSNEIISARGEYETLGSRLDSISNSIPPYYLDYMQNKIKTIRDNGGVSSNVLSFVFITDTHIMENAKNSVKLIKYIQEHTNCAPFVVFGGDVVKTIANDLEDVLEQGDEFQRYIAPLDKSRVFQVRGNHDYIGILPNNESVSAPIGMVKKYLVGGIAPFYSNVKNTYYYIDVPSNNVRLIVLDHYDASYGLLSASQVNWLLNDALNCSGKDIIFFSHQSADPEVKGYSNAMRPIHALLLALRNKTQLNFTELGPAMVKDFTNDTNRLVMHLVGHCHDDDSNIDNGVVTIATNCDAYYMEDSHGYDRTIGTINEQCFDVVNVDLVNRKIYLTRIGAGLDREFSF